MSQTRANLDGGELDGEKQSQASINGGELDFEDTWKLKKKPTRVIIEGGGLQARANLNGGELDEEPVLRNERGQTYVTWMWNNKQRIVLSPRTVLNGGERGREHVREAKNKGEGWRSVPGPT